MRFASNPRALAALLFLTLAWGCTWILAKIALREVAPFTFAAQASLAAAVCLFVALPLIGHALRLRGWKRARTLGIAAAGRWAWGSVRVKQWHAEFNNANLLSFTAWQMLLSTILLYCVSWAVPEPTTHWSEQFIPI